MHRTCTGLFVGLALVAMAGCSSHHYHHGMMGGGKSDAYWQKGRQDLEGFINRTVQDPNKAQEINALVGEILNELKAGREQERNYHRQLYTLNTSYTAEPAEFSKILNEATIQRTERSAKVLSLRFKMKELMTADEWKALSDNMLSYSSRYQHGSGGPKSGY